MDENDNSTRCEALGQGKVVLYVNVGMALSIWVMLSLTQSCVSRCLKPQKWVLGIAFPINAIHTSPHRMVYVLAFSAVSGDVLSLIVDRQPLLDYGVVLSEYSTAITTILQAMLTIADTILTIIVDSLIYLPLFACIDAPVPVIGYTLGLLFVPLLVFRQIIAVHCSTELWITLTLQLPIILCLCVQFIWFCWRITRAVPRLIRAGPVLKEALLKHEATTYHTQRVKSLFRRPSPKIIRRGAKGLMYKVLTLIYPYDSDIHLPLRFLAALVIMTYATYWLTLKFSTETFSLARQLDTYLRGNGTLAERTRESGLVYGFVLGLVYMVQVVLPAGPIIAFVWNLVVMLFMVREVRVHIQKVARGDFSFVAAVPSPSFRLLNSMKYTSFQIAYFVWSWFLVWLIASLAGIVGYVIYFLTAFYKEPFLLSVATAIMPIAYSLIVNWGQLIFIKLCFVGDTNNKNTVIKNLRLFHVFSYFFFFHNIVIGIASCFIRIVLGLLFGLILFFRLDRVVLMKGLERFDNGHTTYVSFLYVEHTQNNSVVHTFIDVVQEAVRERAAYRCGQEDIPKCCEASESLLSEDPPQKLPPRYPRKRWLVAYSMIRNPDVRAARESQAGQQSLVLNDGQSTSLQETHVVLLS